MALPNFPIDESYLVATWLASAFWGAFTVIFAFTLVSIITRPAGARNVVTTSAIIIMWILATVHVSIALARIIEAFIIHINDDGGAVFYLADIGQPLNRAKDMIYVTLIILGDLVLIWRCFMVWNRNYYVIALPCLMVLGTGVSGYGAIGQYFLPDPFTSISVEWAEGMLAVSMATNIIVTALTAGRIWKLTRGFGGMSFTASDIRYRTLILLIIESGVAVTISKTIEFVLFELSPNDGLNGLNALYIVMDCMPQIMCIAPTFIILAVNRGLTSSGAEAYTITGEYGSGRGSVYGRAPAYGVRGVPGRIAFAVPKATTSVQSDTTASFPLQYIPGKKLDFDVMP